MNLDLRRKAVTVLLGPNGCGKTTLLKIINGLLRPSKGAVYVEGRDAAVLGNRELALLMGYVPQAQKASFPFSVEDIVLTGRMPHLSALAEPGSLDVEKARNALDLVGASQLSGRPITQISGGEHQLVMIARALAQEPKYLLLDEPTSNLDFKNQVAVLKMIRGIVRDEGLSAIMTLHDPNHALMFSDEVVLLRKLKRDANCDREMLDASLNSVVAVGTPQEVITPRNIREAYDLEVEVLTVRGRRLLFPL
jgi:iron complex transport system ATP-binding protein